MADEKSMEKVDGKKRKGSMKKKKNWRKNTDIGDVEEHLDDIRRQERTGGIVSEKPNEALFFIEKQSTDLDGNPSKVFNEKTLDKSKEAIVSSDEEEYVPKKVQLQKKRQLEKENERQAYVKIPKVSNDVWSKPTKKSENIWEEPAMKKSIKKPKTVGEKPASVKPVEVCQPGASYNPEYDDHQKILGDALKKETEVLKKQEKLQNKLKFLSDEEFRQKPGWLDEMSEGLVANEKTEKEHDVSSAEEEDIVLSKSVHSEDRKTKKLRKKEKQRLQEEKLKEEEKKKKVQLNDIYRLRSLKKELKTNEEEKAEKIKLKNNLKLRRSARPQRLGKMKYQDPKIDFQLSEELSGNLRGLKPEGDPFLDRMKSFEKRSLIEPRKKVIPHRKYKVKIVDKRSYKKPTVKDFAQKSTSISLAVWYETNVQGADPSYDRRRLR